MARHLRQHSRARPGSDCRLFEASARRGAEAAQPDRDEDRVEPLDPEIHVAVDRKRAADLGVRMSTIGNILRLAVSGDDEISFYKEGPDSIPVKIRVLENQRRDIEEIGRLTVPSDDRRPVRIDNIARLERGLGPSALQQSDRQFAVNLSPTRSRSCARRGVERCPPDARRPQDADDDVLQAAGTVEDPRRDDRQPDMAIGLAMIFVYMVLASQFESFLQPIVIMLVMPLRCRSRCSRCGHRPHAESVERARHAAAARHREEELDPAGGLRQRAARQGLPLREAIVESCRTRLRPILMTTTAIIAGLIPTSLGIGIGGSGRAAIAVTIIGGQALCLFLTLLLVPVAYVKFDALEQAFIGGGPRPGSTRCRRRRSAACDRPRSERPPCRSITTGAAARPRLVP